MTEVKVKGSAGGKKTLFLLDTAAILEAPNLTPSDCLTVPKVVAEVSPGGAGHRRLEQMLAAGLEVRIPTNDSMRVVTDTAKGAGNWGRLSAADVEILSLARDLPDATLVSDDYTVLDLAKRLKIRVQTVRTKGIETTKDWVARCMGCGRSYEEDRAGKPCLVCGAEIRLKPRKR